VVLDTTLAPEALVAAARARVMAVDPEQPVHAIRTVAELRDRNIAPERMNLLLVGIFAGLALSLAVVGLYGVFAYTVAQRQRAIGVRLALGAPRAGIVRMVVARSGRRTALVLAVALAASYLPGGRPGADGGPPPGLTLIFLPLPQGASGKPQYEPLGVGVARLSAGETVAARPPGLLFESPEPSFAGVELFLLGTTAIYQDVPGAQKDGNKNTQR
jgi:FtsX-like permease family protein